MVRRNWAGQPHAEGWFGYWAARWLVGAVVYSCVEEISMWNYRLNKAGVVWPGSGQGLVSDGIVRQAFSLEGCMGNASAVFSVGAIGEVPSIFLSQKGSW